MASGVRKREETERGERKGEEKRREGLGCLAGLGWARRGGGRPVKDARVREEGRESVRWE